MDKSFAEIKGYVEDNPLAVLGTIGDHDNPHGAAVYVCTDGRQPILYFLTKTGTRKYKDLSLNEFVSLTIFNATDNSTLQASGQTFLVDDAITIDKVMQKMSELHAKSIEWLPPLSKLRAGPYVIIGIRLESARLARFKNESIGSEHIFTQL